MASSNDRYEIIETIELGISELVVLNDNPDELNRLKDQIQYIEIRLQEAVLSFPSLCYEKIIVDNPNYKRSVKVVGDTIRENYKEFLLALLRLYVEYVFQGLRSSTIGRIAGDTKKLFKYLFEAKLPITAENAKLLLSYITERLLHEVRIYDKQAGLGMKSLMAASVQRSAVDYMICLSGLDRSKLISGIKLVQENSNQIERPVSIDDEQYGREFSFYTVGFRQLSSIILKHKPLPAKISILGETYWLAPSRSFLKSKKEGLRGFNYDTGKFYTYQELRKLGFSPRAAHGAKSMARQSRETADSPGSNARLSIASLACNLYFMHFLILTGSNDSTAATQLCEDLYIGKSKSKFVNIKFRGSRPVSYQIQRTFLKDFNEYIKLRNYIVDIVGYSEYEFLFIPGVRHGKLSKPIANGKQNVVIRMRLKRYFGLVFSTSRQIRLTKGLWVRSNAGEEMAAYSLQHSIATSNEKYTDSNNDSKTASELTDYFEKLEEAFKSNRKGKETPVGTCLDFGNPVKIESAPVQVNCKKEEGCLFCAKYLPHADEMDIRKLLSLEYIIHLSADKARDNAHYERVYGPVLIKISNWLLAIEKIVPENRSLINDVRISVYEREELSEYWVKKLNLLQSLGII